MTAPLSSVSPEHRKIGVLFVCLGNICRSPAAEGCFLHLLAQEGLQDSFHVDSAGTGHWHVGKPADPRMRKAADRRGLVLPSRARQIHPTDLDRFAHILTMDNDNHAAVLQLARGQSSLAKIEPITSYCRHHNLEEVPDPYYGGPKGFEQVLDILQDACAGLLDDLRPLLD